MFCFAHAFDYDCKGRFMEYFNVKDKVSRYAERDIKTKTRL